MKLEHREIISSGKKHKLSRYIKGNGEGCQLFMIPMIIISSRLILALVNILEMKQ